MKKIFCMAVFCLLGLLMSLLYIPSGNAEALMPPANTTTADYFSGSFDSAEEFTRWFQSGDAKTQNNGAFAKLIDMHTDYGYLLVPYIDGGSEKPSVNYKSLADFEYGFSSPEYRLKVIPLYGIDSKKYVYSGIARYIKDKLNIENFDNECVVDKNRPGIPINKYIFSEKLINIGGTEIKCVICRTITYSPYADRSTVISDSYSITFIYDGMRISVYYKDAGEENNVINSLKNLKFYEEILNQANYDRTKKEILDLKGQVTEEEKQTETEKPTNSESEKKSKKANIKILGKNTVKCGKSYKYKVKTNGLSGKAKWSVNNKNRAKVSKSGKLKAVKKGTVKLTVKIQKCKSFIRIRIV